MIKLVVYGAQGRMGRRICALARDDTRFDLAAEIDQNDHSTAALGGYPPCDAIIDFSSDRGARQAAHHAPQHHAALLVGTTALSRQTLQQIELAANHAPVMIAPNMALGIAVCNHLAAEAARLLGGRFDVDIIEKHHRAKRDAPSGTALRLAETIRTRGGLDLPAQRVHSVRAGDIVGEHAVEFSGAGERLRIEHIVTSRDVFALGALEATAWLCRQKPGCYTVEQFLGLPSQA